MTIRLGIMFVILLIFVVIIVEPQFSETVSAKCAQIIINTLYEKFYVVAVLGRGRRWRGYRCGGAAFTEPGADSTPILGRERRHRERRSTCVSLGSMIKNLKM